MKGSYSHNLANLLKLAGLESDFRTEETADADFRLSWGIVKDWSESARYAEHSEKKAHDLYRAIADGSHGVMRWIKRHW